MGELQTLDSSSKSVACNLSFIAQRQHILGRRETIDESVSGKPTVPRVEKGEKHQVPHTHTHTHQEVDLLF